MSEVLFVPRRSARWQCRSPGDGTGEGVAAPPAPPEATAGGDGGLLKLPLSDDQTPVLLGELRGLSAPAPTDLRRPAPSDRRAARRPRRSAVPSPRARPGRSRYTSPRRSSRAARHTGPAPAQSTSAPRSSGCSGLAS